MKLRSVKRKKKLLSIFFLLFLLALISILIFQSWSGKKIGPQVPAPAAVEKPIAVPPLQTEKLIIPKGKTITDLLTKYGFTQAQVIEIREKTRLVYDLARIPAGQELRLLKQNGKYFKLQLDIDAEHYLEIDLKDDQPEASIKSYPVEKKLALIEGVIEDSLIAAINRAGEQDLLALMLSEIFGWDIDFYVDLRKGDVFRLLVEKKYINGQFSSYGRILAAYFLNKGQLYEAFRFEYPESGKADYFDSRGNSLRREFLKSPLRYARITSRFSYSRLHPIRKIYRPHYGVDYAAPVGTPVQATAPGVVTYAGWNGGAGRMIKIRHNNSYETMYLHLRAFAPGIHVGARVQGGQVIGYVGSTGESTGPHLDYRILYHGKYVNPLSWRFQPAEPLAKEYLPEFEGQVKILKFMLLYPFNFYFSR
ncbi:MAG: M23 family metallopeptidase [Candidatus Aminicenantes bacterium]|nr:M23 family metallopeptidase [Candidatus Aminicenantes bacterium]